MAENLENRRKKLIFRSWHRGTKEMDLLLGSFADEHVMDFSAEELDQFEELLGFNDPDLYSWVTGNAEPPANLDNSVWQRFSVYKLNLK